MADPTFIHTLNLSTPALASDMAWAPNPVRQVFSIAPHDLGVCRVTLGSQYAQTSMGWTRNAMCHEIPVDCYRSWEIQCPQKDLLAWGRASVVRLVCDSHDRLQFIHIDGVQIPVLRATDNPLDQCLDTARWESPGDARWEVRIGAWRRAMQVLRGPGRHVRAIASVQARIHPDIPLDLPQMQDLSLRVISLSRKDVSIRTDIAAACSRFLLETLGLGFSLEPMLALLRLAKPCPDQRLVSVGFDPAIASVFLRFDAPEENVTLMHRDANVGLESAWPANRTAQTNNHADH